MGKLGKKARKFAKKNLQSVMKKKRKFNSMSMKKKAPKNEKDVVEDKPAEDTVAPTGRKLVAEDVEDASLDISTSEEDDMVGDSESDGYLSEDPSCLSTRGNEDEPGLVDASQGNGLSTQNQKLESELLKKRKKLDALKLKDPNFATYLQDRIKSHELFQNDDMSDEEEEITDHDIESADGGSPTLDGGKVLNISTISSWCQLAKQQQKQSMLPSLLNAYRAACHFGGESVHDSTSALCPVIKDKETFCSIVMFMLSEGDNLLRGVSGIPSICKKDAILNLKDSSKWGSLKPMIKSYLTSTLYLVNQFSETDILAFALTRLRASLVFFAAFPALTRDLMEVAVHLWATGAGDLSSCSFLILHDMSSSFNQETSERCFKKTYKAILSHCKVVDPSSLKHIKYLTNSFVELCSTNLQRSVQLAMVSIQKLATILQLALQTKEETLQKICSWEYTVCVDLWVSFISANIKDNDLHGLLYVIIQVIIGVDNLFPGQHFLPLKIKCIQWLNNLSSSSGIFIPISNLALDILDSSPPKEVAKTSKTVVNLSTTLQLPKYWVKTRDFQDECVSAAVELLCAHFIKWSHHISFPELATVPVIRLKKFHDKSTVESLRRTVKRLLDQVEKNIDFVLRKRDEVPFSPKDQASADLFLQSEKGGNSPFIQYYTSMIQNAETRKVTTDDKTSLPEKKNTKQKLPQKTKDANGEGESGNTTLNKSRGRKKNKKQRT